MDHLQEMQEIIEEITYDTLKFPERAFQEIRKRKDEAIPYLREAIEHAIAAGMDLEEDYMLHIYALYLLAEFQDKDSFERIMVLASFPSDIEDYLLGDVVTEDLWDILYNTYNGNLDVLKASVMVQDLDEYVRGAMLNVLAQLFVDGALAREDWKDFLEELSWQEYNSDYIYTEAAGMICRCHLVELLPEVRRLYNEDLLDTYIYGKYDSLVDMMYAYDEEYEEEFCKPEIVAADRLRNWAMFNDGKDSADGKNPDMDFSKAMDTLIKETRKAQTTVKALKIGRNDPCPCGSGRKYKQCCLNKPQGQVWQIESRQEREKWLRDYPKTGTERVEGRVYLEDRFDSESIEIDKLIYLAIKHRPIPIWNRERTEDVDKRKQAYLWEAFSQYAQKRDREGIQSTREYDEKYSIHYEYDEWMPELLMLLKLSKDQEKYDQVMGYYEVPDRVR